MPFAGQEKPIYKTNYQLISGLCDHNCKTQPQKIKSVLFAQSFSPNQSTKLISKSNFVSHRNSIQNKQFQKTKKNLPPNSASPELGSATLPAQRKHQRSQRHHLTLEHPYTQPMNAHL